LPGLLGGFALTPALFVEFSLPARVVGLLFGRKGVPLGLGEAHREGLAADPQRGDQREQPNQPSCLHGQDGGQSPVRRQDRPTMQWRQQGRGIHAAETPATTPGLVASGLAAA